MELRLQEMQRQMLKQQQTIRTLQNKDKRRKKNQKGGREDHVEPVLASTLDVQRAGSNETSVRERQLEGRVSLLSQERRKLTFALASAREHIIRLTGRLALGHGTGTALGDPIEVLVAVRPSSQYFSAI